MPCSTPALPPAKRAACSPGLDAAAAGLDANQPHRAIGDERVEDAHGVAAAADAGHDGVGQPADRLETLRARLLPMTDWNSRTISG